MAIDPHYIPAFSIEDVILDKDTGYPLSGGYVYFYEDNQRTQLKPVYQITGTSPDYSYIPLPNPMILSSIGTFIDSLGNPVIPYFYPYVEGQDPEELLPDYYFVEVFSSTAVFQFSREAVPYIPDIGTQEFESVLTNAISNPQFSRVLFDTTVSNSATFTFLSATNQVFPIAPDWDFIVTCPSSGSITVSQITPTGSTNVITNPGTLLNIKASGITSLLLRQRLYGSPNLWGNGYLSASFIAKTYTGTTLGLNLYYSQSGGTVTQQPIIQATLTQDGNYNAFSGSIELPISNNPNASPTAYVDIYFDIPTTAAGIDISSVAVVGTANAPIDNVIYDQVPVAREIDQLYNYYDPLLRFKAIPSMLVGWDFPLNPRSFLPQQSNTTTAGYVLDQTIIQSTAANLSVSSQTGLANLQITTNAANEAFYLLQYLDGYDAVKTRLSLLSSNINAYASTSDVVMQVTMYYSTGNGTPPALPTTIGTVAYNAGVPVFSLGVTPGAWTQITQVGGNFNTAKCPSTNGDVGFLGYNGLANYASTTTTQYFAIVVSFACPTSGTVININSISLVPGLIATRPAPLTFETTLNECRYYYETSYPAGVVAGTANSADAVAIQQIAAGNGTNIFAYPESFERKWLVDARPTMSGPLLSFYNTLGTANYVYGSLSQVGATSGGGISTSSTILAPGQASALWVISFRGQTGFTIDPSTQASPSSFLTATSIYAYGNAWIAFHYVKDARIGVA